MFAQITKVNEEESNTPCPTQGICPFQCAIAHWKGHMCAIAHWKGHIPWVEKLSKALQSVKHHH
jgi:hypothetical protein